MQDGYDEFRLSPPPSQGYKGVSGKVIDKIIDQLIIKHEEIPALLAERSLLSLIG